MPINSWASLSRFSKAAKPPLLAMANRADLAKRVRAVLNHRQHRGRAGRFPVLAAGAIAAVLVLTMSPLTMVALPQSAGGADWTANGSGCCVPV